MTRQHTPPSPCSHLSRAIACDDTVMSHRRLGNTPLRIILADDHPVVLMGAEMALGDLFSIVARAHDADELINLLQHTPCDLLISDYSMPSGRLPDGLALMSYLKRHFHRVPLMVMTMLNNPSLLQALLNLGVCGLFDKRSPLENLKRAVHTVTMGGLHMCPSFAGILDAQVLPPTSAGTPLVKLSERELEVVRLFVQGLSGRQIAARLNRSEKTISRQKRTAMAKLGLGHGGGLVEFARVSGLHN